MIHGRTDARDLVFRGCGALGALGATRAEHRHWAWGVVSRLDPRTGVRVDGRRGGRMAFFAYSGKRRPRDVCGQAGWAAPVRKAHTSTSPLILFADLPSASPARLPRQPSRRRHTLAVSSYLPPVSSFPQTAKDGTPSAPASSPGRSNGFLFLISRRPLARLESTRPPRLGASRQKPFPPLPASAPARVRPHPTRSGRMRICSSISDK